MLKLKKIVLACSVILLGLSSCNSDDDSGTSNLEGRWRFTKEGVILNNEEVLMDYEHTAGCTPDFTEILSGNVIKDHYFDNPGCEETIDTGTWNRTNNSLVFTYPGEATVNAEIASLTNTTLKIKTIISGTTRVVVLTRI